MTSTIQELTKLGQSIWYDNIENKVLKDGTLEGMIQRGEIRGVTSNPSIFNKAISQSTDYDQEIEILSKKGLSREQIYEQLVIQDIQDAADLFLPLYQQSEGGDGYVSLEVNPTLAYQTEETIQEAKRLWDAVDRPNLMVKIPATAEGLPAITESIASGININVTLIFGLGRYQQVKEAYLSGLEKRASRGETINSIASVASFFISRIDTKLDLLLEDLKGTVSAKDQKIITNLLGKAAVASGKLAYEQYQRTFGGEGVRFQNLHEQGARRQRVLWASTSTKNPLYPDTKYVEELIGPLSINTMPPATLIAFMDHGVVEKTIDKNLDASRDVFQTISALGIDLDQATQELEDEGVKAFADAFSALLDTIEKRMDQYLQT
jgi:transaldolase